MSLRLLQQLGLSKGGWDRWKVVECLSTIEYNVPFGSHVFVFLFGTCGEV